jgi:hypothetical protein
MKNDSLRLSPLKNYKPPKIPTLDDTRGNPGILKNLPLRWQKKTAVIACMTFAGMVTLAGCDYAIALQESQLNHGGGAVIPFYSSQPAQSGASQVIQPQPADHQAQPPDHQARIEAAISAAELNLRLHTGGSGFGPFYVVHITEQEALGIIRALLEAKGLDFNAEPPPYSVDFAWDSTIGLDLFDSEKNVAISHISWEENNTPFFSHGGSHLSEEIAKEFAELASDISVGVFFNPGEFLGFSEHWWGWEQEGWEEYGEYEPPTEESKEEAKAALIKNISEQVQEFISFLQAEGVI